MRYLFLLAFVLYFAGNVYIGYRGWQTLAGCQTWGRVLFLILYACWVLFAWYAFRTEKGAHIFYVLGSGWLIATLYLVVWLLATDLFSAAASGLRIPAWSDPQFIHRWAVIRFWGAFSLIICLLIIGNYRYKHPAAKVINIVINKPLTAVSDSFRIVAVSDLHLGYDTDKPMLRRYVERINGLKPDLILIGGDLIDRSVPAVRNQRMQEDLNRLEAPLGVYMVPGNHEYYAGIRQAEEFLRQTRVHWLRDSVIILPNGLTIVGRDDYTNGKRLPLDRLLAAADREKPLVLLDHQPRRLDEAVQAGIDLQFSGHTHNGQIWPFPYLVKRLFELGYGLRRKGDTWQYVSSGLSLWGPPYRIGTQSELVVFDLTFKQ